VKNRPTLAVATEALQRNRRPSEVVGRPERLLRFPLVKERVPYSHSTIYAKVKDGTFPRPVNLGGRAVAWRESDIDAWIEGRTEAE
jgi:prophage regulatory protein